MQIFCVIYKNYVNYFILIIKINKILIINFLGKLAVNIFNLTKKII